MLARISLPSEKANRRDIKIEGEGSERQTDTGPAKLLYDLGRFQKVVIPRGIEGQAAHTSSVDQDVIEVPQVDGRNIVRQDLLNFSIKSPADILIRLAAGLVDEVVDPWIEIETAIPACRRKVT